MGWEILWFCVTVVVTVGVCWWFWKGTDKEKAALMAEIERLRAKAKDL